MPTLCTHGNVNKKGKGSESLIIMKIYSDFHCWFETHPLCRVQSLYKKKAITISFINPFIAKLMLQQCTETTLHELCLFDFISLIQSVWIHLHLYKATLYNIDISCLRNRQTHTLTLRQLSCHVKGWWYQYHHFGEKMCKRSHSPIQSSSFSKI